MTRLQPTPAASALPNAGAAPNAVPNAGTAPNTDRIPNAVASPEQCGSSVLFAQILVEEGVLKPGDLRKLLQVQQSVPLEQRRPIARLAVEQGLCDEGRFQDLLDRHCRRLHLGELLILRGLISLADLDRAVREQQKSGGLLGEIMIAQGLLTPQALCEGLAQQSGLSFAPIAKTRPRPDLARWVNASFARLHGIVPVACEARRLTVAIWQPRSLAIVSDLEQSTGLKVSVVLTTRAEIEERYAGIYGEAA